jgi:hypothetical protein
MLFLYNPLIIRRRGRQGGGNRKGIEANTE